MRKLIIDDVELEVPDDYSVLQACEEAGVEIPRFCYHERLSVAGNCRMCLVEAKGAPKPIASCAFGVKDLRPGPNGEPPVIETRSPMVKKAREGVMEFLLINHPLDCPICDQGGECDLQDQAMYYGVDSSRYAENKRAVEDKYIGPLVKTVMTRCIHCTRCVRFTTEVAGVSDLGATGRGEDMEITTYLEKAMTSEMQGNVIDLCPVGALTSRPYAFQARPWELSKTETIDVMDALGCHIRVDSRGNEVLRIMPRVNDDINEEWISDKSRFHWDGLRTQRLDQPFIRKNGKLTPASWGDALQVVADKIKATDAGRVAGITGDFASVEEMFALKTLLSALGSERIESRTDGSKIGTEIGVAGFTMNSGIAGIEDADAILLIGTNPREEATVMNARIRKRWLQGPLPVAVIGDAHDFGYDYEHLGVDKSGLASFAKSEFAKVLNSANKPMIIVGQAALCDADAANIVAKAASIAVAAGAVSDDWNGFNVLHNAASRVGGLAIGAISDGGIAKIASDAQSGSLDVIINIAADGQAVSDFGNAFTIYIGSHGDAGAHKADVILPGAAYTEKMGLFVNTEGRVQSTSRATFPPGDARDDWSILRALAGYLGLDVGFDSFAQLRSKVMEAHPEMSGHEVILPRDAGDVEKLAKDCDCGSGKFTSLNAPYFLANPILRASNVMAECAALKEEKLPMAAE